MSWQRRTAVVVGVLFLVAMVASLAGGVLLEGVIGAGDWLTGLLAARSMVSVGVTLEIINALAVVGIGALLFPMLRPHGEGVAAAYLGLRLLEAAACTLAALVPLALLTLAQGSASADNRAVGLAIGNQSLVERDLLLGVATPLLMGLGGLLLYSLLYRSRLLPRFIAVWGLIGVVLMWVMNLLPEVGGAAMVLVLPLILNEIYLGLRLIIKGWREA